MLVFDPYDPDHPRREFDARLSRRARGAGEKPVRSHAGRRALALAAAVAVPAFAAPADWSALTVGDAGKAEVQLQPMPFERAGDSFPGSAFYYLAPDEPQAAGQSDAAEGYGLAVARALRVSGSETDRSRALTCLTQAIYYEAASEPDAGQRAVAQVVLNRVAHPSFPNTVCGVVYQGSERSTGCQFTFTCDGSLARAPVRQFWLRAESVARAALSGYVYAPVGLATHYHTIAVHPYWSDTLNYRLTIGAHRFYELRGPAGAPNAFRAFAYAGGEPVAAPRPHVAGAVGPDPSLDPLAIERAYAAAIKASPDSTPTTLAAPQSAGPRSLAAPSYAPEVQARGGESLYRANRLPEGQGVKPEYQNSGRWIAQPGT